MAYRFNPPPNWPIEDPNWTPPPGWQPDPSWGPPPADWNFWVADDAPAESVQDAPLESADDTPVAGAEAAPADHPEEQDPADATHQAHAPAPAPEEPTPSTEAHAPAPVSPEPGGENFGEATHRATADEQQPDQSEPVPLSDAPDGGASATAEYEGPDLEADLKQQTPYETGDQDFPQQPEQETGTDQADTVHEHSAGGTPFVAAGSGYGQPSPNQGYGQASPNHGYGQPSPNHGYGQASPNQGYGSPDSASSWTATTGSEDAPKKGVVARFWWVGCLVLLLVGLLIAVLAGGMLLMNRGGEEEPTGDGGTTTSASADPTDDPTATEEEPTSEEPTTEEASEEAVTPSVLPTVDPAAESVEVVSNDGRGTMQVSMEWLPAEQLPSKYGGNVEPAEHGEYLVVTAKLSVTEGQMFFSNAQFDVVTPYGGELGTDLEAYALKDSGIELDAPTDIKAGEEYTMRMLFAPKRAGGMQLEYDTYTDQYTWDIAE